MDHAYQKRVLGMASVAAKASGKDGDLDGIVMAVKVSAYRSISVKKNAFDFRRGGAKALPPHRFVESITGVSGVQYIVMATKVSVSRFYISLIFSQARGNAKPLSPQWCRLVKSIISTTRISYLGSHVSTGGFTPRGRTNHETNNTPSLQFLQRESRY